jgi:molybdopterin-guanine dinucleotide biosynthesis protein MobB
MPIPVICIIGESGSGKTILLEKLIPELKHRDYRIATVKHLSHLLGLVQRRQADLVKQA